MEAIFDDSQKERKRQRSESEARYIIHDVGKLAAYGEDKKS